MTNFKEESRRQNWRGRHQNTNYALDSRTPVTGSTLQGKASPRIEISITRQQLNAITQVFGDYSKPKPGWLRQRFYINQRRRKCLNVELTEAGLDSSYCGHHQTSDTWDGQLHQLWHQVNGAPLCK